MVLGASRLGDSNPTTGLPSGLNAPNGAGCFPTPRATPNEVMAAYVSMHLMVLGASRLPDKQLCYRQKTQSRCTWWCWVLPDPSACCPLSRLGKRAPDRHWSESVLGPCSTSSIEADFAQFSQGLPPMGLQGLRAARSRRGHADPGAVLCSSDTSAQARAVNREALARRPPGGGCGRVVGEERRRRRRLGGSCSCPSGWRALWGRRCRRGAMLSTEFRGPGAEFCGPVSCSWSLRRRPPAAGVACWCGCYMRDKVVSMEIASLTRRPRVRITEVMGSEPIAWNSLSVRSPVGA